MSSLPIALATAAFPADEVERLLQTPNAPERTLVLAAVRAESDGRFLEALSVFFESLDWSSVAAAEYGHHPTLAMLGAARGESATNHLAATELVKLCKLADKPDAVFALDVVRAIELADTAAAERVRARVASSLSQSTARGMYSAPDNAVAASRLASLFLPLVGETDEDRLRTAATFGFGYGAWAAYLAAAIADRRGIALTEDVASLQHSGRLCGRSLASVAFAIDPVFGEEMLELIVEKDWLEGDLEGLALPWALSAETSKGGKLTVTRLLGSTVVKATGPFDTFQGPPPKKRPKWRLTAKRHPNAAKAQKDFEKAAAELGDPIAFAQSDLDARLYDEARIGRERVMELLRRGASPNRVDPQNKGTALHRAAGAADCGELVRRLLAAGADPNVVDAFGDTPLDGVEGLTSENAVAAERLVAAGGRCKKSRLIVAAERGFHRIVPALLRAGADPAERSGGMTALEIAREKRHLRTARAIDSKGESAGVLPARRPIGT